LVFRIGGLAWGTLLAPPLWIDVVALSFGCVAV